MYNTCCIRGCGNKRKYVKMHQFPSNAGRLQNWREIVAPHIDRTIRSAKDVVNLFICNAHFEKRFLTAKTRLKIHACPTLFTKSEIESGKPCRRYDTSMRPNLFDHDYSKSELSDHTYSQTVISQADSSALSGVCVMPEKLSTQAIHCVVEINAPQPSTSKGTDSAKRLGSKVVPNVKSLTPKCKKIYREYKKSRKQLNFQQRAKRALKFSSQENFEAKINKMNPYARKIFDIQIKMCCKKSKARRFTKEEKLIALSILKQSPKCYRFLRKIFILPSKSTLNKMIARLNIGTGVNKTIIEVIKKEVSTWDKQKKYCSIIFDEVSLDLSLHYNKSKDEIDGFVELKERAPQFADHALVFMLRGAVLKWQQPLAYYFCEGATNSQTLKQLIKMVVEAVGETGLIPVALICDQGSAFQSALNSLQQDTKREMIQSNENYDDTVKINESKLHIIYDACNLIKGLRNNMLDKDIIFDGKRARSQDIMDIYKADCSHTLPRLLHKLNDEHVIPDKIKKMKVRNCVQVFSKRVAAALSFASVFTNAQYPDGTPVGESVKHTAEIVTFFDDLFDSVNGSSLFNKKNKAKDLLKAVTPTSRHHEFWDSAIKKLSSMKYEGKKGLTTIPTLKNWITTLKSLKALTKFFFDNGVKVFRPRYFNSDPIENFFGQVRAYNYRNTDPSCYTFAVTFKSLLITRFLNFHSYSFSCEEDAAVQLLDLQKIFSVDAEQTQESSQLLPSASNVEVGGHSTSVEILINEVRRQRLEIQSRAYTCGWVVRKLLQQLKCSNCEQSLTTQTPSPVHSWVSQREYKQARKLCYPKEQVVKQFGAIITETNEILENYGHEKNISELIENKLSDIHLTNNCSEHKDSVSKLFLKVSIRFVINNWVNSINKILKGVDVIRINPLNLPPMQAKALIKLKKKCKKKKKEVVSVGNS